jgi:hypothetical protein
MPILTIDKFYGGLSSGERLGIDGSFYFSNGLNYKDNPDAITGNLGLVKDSATTVVDLIKWGAYDTVALNHYFYGDGGRIYRRTSAGVYSVLRTVSNSSGQGLEVFNDYVWYTQNSQLGRYGVLSGAPSFTDNWQTGLNGTTSWRPLKNFLNLLLVGNGRYLGTVDSASTWTATKLTFPIGWYVRDIDVMGDYACIAVNDAEDITKATRGILFFWDGSSSTFNFFSELNEGGGISSIQANQDSVVINAGLIGNLYLYTGKNNKIKRVPFVGRGKTAYVYPGANCNFNGMTHFGISNGTSTNVYRGVYAYGQPELDYPNSLNFEYQISTQTTTGTTLQIGCLFPFGNQLFVSWKDASTYGMDLLSTTDLQPTLSYKTRLISFDQEVEFTRFKIFFDTLTAGLDIKLYRYADRGGQTLLGRANYEIDGGLTNKLFEGTDIGFRATDVQFELALNNIIPTATGTVTTMPTVSKLLVEYKPTNTL